MSASLVSAQKEITNKLDIEQLKQKEISASDTVGQDSPMENGKSEENSWTNIVEGEIRNQRSLTSGREETQGKKNTYDLCDPEISNIYHKSLNRTIQKKRLIAITSRRNIRDCTQHLTWIWLETEIK